jgi:hypothetical protein
MATLTITVNDVTPPVFSNVRGPITAECAGPGGTPVTVPLPTASDACDGTVPVTSNAPALFPAGTTTVTFTAKDAARNTATATTTVTVVDVTPPGDICLSASPKELWPPNHKMVPVTVKVCDRDTWTNCQIFSVTSNEPVNNEDDGNTTFDWQITGPLTVNLRAERSGTGSGRVYTITVHCTDKKGNPARSTVKVTVPKNQGEKDD